MKVQVTISNLSSVDELGESKLVLLDLCQVSVSRHYSLHNHIELAVATLLR